MTRAVVITGVAGGIGQACAAAFAAAGWTVIGLDVAPAQVPGVSLQLACDIADDDAMRAAFARVAAAHPSVQALVNNAAIQLNRKLVDTTVEEWDAVMGANVRGVFLGIKYAVPLLRGAGAIVNVASVHAVATSASVSAYAASKGAVVALTRAAAVELAPLGIRVNAILPGAVDTQMLRDGLGRGHVAGDSVEARLDALAQRTVIGRIGTPGEIASAIAFLADSTQSGFMTGQAMVVDGGATTRLSTE